MDSYTFNFNCHFHHLNNHPHLKHYSPTPSPRKVSCHWNEAKVLYVKLFHLLEGFYSFTATKYERQRHKIIRCPSTDECMKKCGTYTQWDLFNYLPNNNYIVSQHLEVIDVANYINTIFMLTVLGKWRIMHETFWYCNFVFLLSRMDHSFQALAIN